ncbi:hypothetical protein Purlil1_13673 [Purpureocillium lilacinum]|uniref:Uncharacterized protein n=1 Tax=Purpureocillium lilacinum TaxID=33203 RepID=A0ABR0BDF0_PURLI|nr:hypothetical protein Purlil1_13673 [Purpureocillium lilacinum]
MPAKGRLPAATCQRNALNSELIAVTNQPQRPKAATWLAWPASSARMRAGRNPGFKVGPLQLACPGAAAGPVGVSQCPPQPSPAGRSIDFGSGR